MERGLNGGRRKWQVVVDKEKRKRRTTQKLEAAAECRVETAYEQLVMLTEKTDLNK